MFINVDWSAPDTENKIWCNVTSVQPLHNTKPFIFFFITSLPSVFAPVSLLNWAQSAEQQSLVELLWGSIAQLLPRYKYSSSSRYKYSCCWSIYTCCCLYIHVNDSSFIYHHSSLVCHLWTQIHLSCCYCNTIYSCHCWTCCKYVRSNRDDSHNNTCIFTKGTLRSSNAI